MASGVSPPSRTAGMGFLYVYIDVSDDAFWPPGLTAALPLPLAINV